MFRIMHPALGMAEPGRARPWPSRPYKPRIMLPGGQRVSLRGRSLRVTSRAVPSPGRQDAAAMQASPAGPATVAVRRNDPLPYGSPARLASDTGSAPGSVVSCQRAPDDHTSSPNPHEDVPWWAPHAIVIHLLTNSLWVACVAVGGAFWAAWALQQYRRHQAQLTAGAGADAPVQASAEDPDPLAARSGSAAGTATDPMEDPFASIRVLFQASFLRGWGGRSSAATAQPAQAKVRTEAPVAQRGVASSLAVRGAEAVPWWAALTRVYYLNFGAQLGILPRVPSAAAGLSDGPAAVLAFADRADAEYVLGCLRAGLGLAGTPREAAQQLATAAGSVGVDLPVAMAAPAPAAHRPRPTVVSGNPGHLEDICLARGTGLAVIPPGQLSIFYSVQLSPKDLEEVLCGVLVGRQPPVSAPKADLPGPAASGQQQEGAPAAPGAAVPGPAPPAEVLPAALHGRPGRLGLTTQPALQQPPLPDLFHFPGFDDPPAATPPAERRAEGERVAAAPTAGGDRDPAATVAAPVVAPGQAQSRASPSTAQPPEVVSATAVLEPAGLPEGRWADASSRAGAEAPTLQVGRTGGTTQQAREGDAQPQAAIEAAQPGTKEQQETEAGGSGRTNTPPPGVRARLTRYGFTRLAGGDTEAEPDVSEVTDPLIREYEAFKKMFMAARAAPATPPAPPKAAPQGGQDTQDLPTMVEEPSRGPTRSAAAAAPQASPESVVERILGETGPTDAALVQAWSAVTVPVASTPEDVLSEWYALQDQLLNGNGNENGSVDAGGQPGRAAGQPSENQAAASGVRAAVAAKAAAAAAASATPPGGDGGLHEMRERLASLERQLEQLVAGLPAGNLAEVMRDDDAPAAPVAAQAQALQSQVAQLKAQMASKGVGAPPNSDQATHAGDRYDAPARPSPPPPAPTASGTVPTGASASNGKREWGASWARRPAPPRQPQPSQPPQSPPTPASATAAAPAASASPSPSAAAAGSGSAARTANNDGATIISKRAGRDRPWKRQRDPAERQATVKEALRFVSGEGGSAPGSTAPGDEWDDDGNRLLPPDPSVDKVAGIDWDRVDPSRRRDGAAAAVAAAARAPGSGAIDTGREKWWQRRFTALYLPNVRYPDGCVGFVQLDCSLVDGRRDMRVVTFEDRHDCMFCLKIMEQWPEYQGFALEMGALPTKSVEAEIVTSWREQVATGAADRESRPAGVVVFRRGKLAMRLGMSQEQFTQLAVFQAAAQLSLSKVGYEFDDF